MTTQNQTDKPHAEFVGYQQDERVGGVRAWYIVKWPGHVRHLSTVFAPTLIRLGVEVPKTPPYIPTFTFKQVWIHRCENKNCHISYITTKPLIEHIRDTKHIEVVSELVNTTEVPTEVSEEKKPRKVVMLDNTLQVKKIQVENIEDTIPEETFNNSFNPFDLPTEKKKSKKLVLVPGGWNGHEDKEREIIKVDIKKILQKETPEVVKTDVVKPKFPTPEASKKEVDDYVLAFRRDIQAKFPGINWENKNVK